MEKKFALFCCYKIISFVKSNFMKEERFLLLKLVHSFRAESNRDLHRKLCTNHDLHEAVLPVKNNEKILKHLHGSKSIKHPPVIYSDFETLEEKMVGCENNPKRSFTIDVKKTETMWFIKH